MQQKVVFGSEIPTSPHQLKTKPLLTIFHWGSADCQDILLFLKWPGFQITLTAKVHEQ